MEILINQDILTKLMAWYVIRIIFRQSLALCVPGGKPWMFRDHDPHFFHLWLWQLKSEEYWENKQPYFDRLIAFLGISRISSRKYLKKCKHTCFLFIPFGFSCLWKITWEDKFLFSVFRFKSFLPAKRLSTQLIAVGIQPWKTLNRHGQVGKFSISSHFFLRIPLPANTIKTMGVEGCLTVLLAFQSVIHSRPRYVFLFPCYILSSICNPCSTSREIHWASLSYFSMEIWIQNTSTS